MNSELEKVKEWCDLNKLSINMSKTNLMIIKSTSKKDMPVNIQIRNSDGTRHPLVRKNHIKYLRVMIDECVSWKYHISYICSQISRNIGIISKLRHYLSIKQLKQICYNLIYPYIAYAILAWGSTYTSSLKKVQVKQNQYVARLIYIYIYIYIFFFFFRRLHRNYKFKMSFIKLFITYREIVLVGVSKER